jgi:hypothetical protein
MNPIEILQQLANNALTSATNGTLNDHAAMYKLGQSEAYADAIKVIENPEDWQ